MLDRTLIRDSFAETQILVERAVAEVNSELERRALTGHRPPQGSSLTTLGTEVAGWHTSCEQKHRVLDTFPTVPHLAYLLLLVLFADHDEVLEKGGKAKVVGRCLQHGLQLLSVFTRPSPLLLLLLFV